MHRTLSRTFLPLSAALLILAAGCSTVDNLWLGREEAATDPVSRPPEQEALPEAAAIEPEKAPEQQAPLPRAATARKPKVVPAIELSWQVPVETVQYYYLDYGYSPNVLDHRVKIKVSTLEKVDHPVHGPIFRYELKGVRPVGPIYYSLRAENAGKISPPTPVQKLEQ